MNFSWHPPVGVFIAVLALVSVLVPLFREKAGRGEKALWTLVMFILVGLEIRSIYMERNEHDIKQAQVRKEELIRFENIAAGIDNSIINSRTQFKATIARTENIMKLEQSTLGEVKRNFDEMTGGDSYCYINLHHFGKKIFLHNAGKYTLYGLSLRIVDHKDLKKLIEQKINMTIDEVLTVGTTYNIGDLNSTTGHFIDNPYLYDGRKDANFTITFSARNGYWVQIYRLRFIEDKWVAATKVNKHIAGKGDVTLYENIEPGFPRNKNGAVEW